MEAARGKSWQVIRGSLKSTRKKEEGAEWPEREKSTNKHYLGLAMDCMERRQRQSLLLLAAPLLATSTTAKASRTIQAVRCGRLSYWPQTETDHRY